MPIYCGNNLNDPKLVSGTHVLGTNYQCLRRGIGVGINLPYDATYAGVYAPVDPRKFYCGTAAVPPPAGGYFAVGSPSKCLAIGVGVGKARRAAMGPPAFMYFIRYILPYVLFFVMAGGVFAYFYFAKPVFITKRNQDNDIVIDWEKFIPYYFLITIIIGILIWLIWKRFILRWI